MNFISSWATLVKRFIPMNVIFSVRATKLAGINDFANIVTKQVKFVAPNKLEFTKGIPNFLVPLPGQQTKWFVVKDHDKGNNNLTLKVKSVENNIVTVEQNTITQYDSSNVIIDGRLWSVINDTQIAKRTSTGSTMFNVHNRHTTGRGGDASEVAITFAEHYHNDIDSILTHKFNMVGNVAYTKDPIHDTHVRQGPLVVVDNNGNVITRGY